MSEEIASKAALIARTTAVEACWYQWRALGFTGSMKDEKDLASIIDPEALLLLSLYMAPYERRLEDAVSWWARQAPTLLSVQRTISLARSFPNSTGQVISTFARIAAEEAGDRRWRRHATQESGSLAAGRPIKGTVQPRLTHPAALILRLRAGFGVGVKTDLFAYLLGRGEYGASIKEAREALTYSAPAIRTAASEMMLARFLRSDDDRPARYRPHAEPWKEILSNSPDQPDTFGISLPGWRDWSSLFPLLAGVSEWSETAAADDASRYVQSSKARDIMLPLKSVLRRNGIHLPEPQHYRGEAYLDAFIEGMEVLGEWIDAHL